MRSDSMWPSQENDAFAYALTPVGEAYWWRSNCLCSSGQVQQVEAHMQVR